MFISHRGPDTKFGLVGDIKARLERSNVNVFIDADLDAGNFAWDTILAKLRGAKTVLLVLSPKFQTSWWCAACSQALSRQCSTAGDKHPLAPAHNRRRCLEELRIAADRREHILPIFCDVEPGSLDHVSLKQSYADMKRDLPDTPEDTLKQWEDALSWVRGVSGVTGWVHSSTLTCATATSCTVMVNLAI